MNVNDVVICYVVCAPDRCFEADIEPVALLNRSNINFRWSARGVEWTVQTLWLIRW